MSNMRRGGINMDRFYAILEKMEKLRQEMNEVATQKSINDPEVLVVSKKLDEILNQYQELLHKKKK
jgi:hypothetical protein